MDGQKFAQKLTAFVNRMANDKDEKEFVDAMMREHRTLQQSSFNLVCKLIKAWSEQDHWDLRNEHTVKTCKKIIEAVKDVNYSSPCI